MYKYAYLVGDGILVIFWLALFFSRKDLRKQQLFMSFIVTIITPLVEWLHRDYWHPEYTLGIRIAGVDMRIESLFFAFLIGGIATVIYEVVFRKRHFFGKPRSIITATIILTTLAMTLILNKLGLNSIWASSLSILSGSIVMIIIDRDLIKDAIWSSLLTSILIIIFYFIWLNIYPEAIQRFWIAKAVGGIKIWRIPITEIVWFASTGISFGVLYEFWLNVQKYPKK